MEPDIDTSVAHSARVHDYWLGGPGNFAADRTRAGVAGFFSGLELLEPGVVPVERWRLVSEAEARPRSAMWAGVARKPPG